MIEVAQGTPGSGKSAVAVARAIAHLRKGGVVAANFALVEGWAMDVARKTFLGRFSPSYAYDLACSLHSRFHYVNSLPAIRKVFPKVDAVGLNASKEGKYMEGQGLLLIDEAQLVFNSRNSMSGSKNLDWIEFFTQHRKLGWNVILIAHNIEMIDSQIRPLAEYESRFRNLQKVKIPLTPFPVSPFPYFVVVKRYAGLGAGASCIHSREAFPLPLWAAKLYDSLLVFSAESWGRDTSPVLCGSVPSPPCGVGAVPSPCRFGSLVGPHWDSYFMTIPGFSYDECDAILLTELAD